MDLGVTVRKGILHAVQIPTIGISSSEFSIIFRIPLILGVGILRPQLGIQSAYCKPCWQDKEKKNGMTIIHIRQILIKWETTKSFKKWILWGFFFLSSCFLASLSIIFAVTPRSDPVTWTSFIYTILFIYCCLKNTIKSTWHFRMRVYSYNTVILRNASP